ncbi:MULTISPECIES: AMP-binding protein [unclassified Variovorax]|uniref:AMP-binding protein n=1 Tax=unclassified Variovorax TaxID=663243 RepID=UPI00076C4C0F|nr:MULTISPECIES: AMP-binding protein [unclassified Variovorax]KWT83947.1 Long-chain-fatty-acid--CoA ligase [Variovorax sp. WDL1]PNG46626.1 Long-chain-fatty-acid--CoA ligase [Variovorax sp. B2]PNG47552.1 Long-chain-fatty-acid--CoA ligase [Variovorax sp. B4]VTV14404.1 Long-chain-fatty-acid--CoA ligase [Variovorax sp. WDL1]
MIAYRHGQRPLHEYLREHARRNPDKPALVWYGRRISYAELDDLSDRFAQSLRDRGIGQGDVVALFLHNCPQYLIAHFGVQKLGAIVSPCNPDARAYELEHQLTELDVSAIVAGEELLKVVLGSRALRTVAHVYAVRYGDMLPATLAMDVPPGIRLRHEPAPPLPGCVIDFADALAEAGPFAPVDTIAMDDVCLMAYTSGSTGLPKGAMISFECALYKIAVSADGFRLGEGDVMLADVALHHISGMMTGLALPIYCGATVVLLHRFDATAVLQAIEACRVSWWYTMAPSLPSVMACDDAATFDLSSLRTTVGTSFGVQLSESLARRWSRFANACLVYEAGYGLSETHTCDTLMPPDAIKWGTNGKPAPGVELRIVDPETGRDLPAGQRGEILLRSPIRYKGYWLQPAATQAMLLDGWLRTGDVGVVDEEGYLTFLGRTKEMIKVWSYSVFPEEVEAILALHPDVRQAAVVGLPDPDRGEAVQAYVVLKDEAAARVRAGQQTDRVDQKIIEWCLQHMSHYKVPRTVIFRSGLPSSESGKLLRRMLHDPAASMAIN